MSADATCTTAQESQPASFLFSPNVLPDVVFSLPLHLFPSNAQLLLQPCPRIYSIIFHLQINSTLSNSSFFSCSFKELLSSDMVFPSDVQNSLQKPVVNRVVP